jgi:Nitrogen regulatory protein P-II
VKAVVVVTDSEAMKEFERSCLSSGSRGFTIIPKVWGRGKTGIRAGDRVHPGGSSLLFTVVPDGALAETLEFLRGVRDRAGAREVTKIFVAEAEEAD